MQARIVALVVVLVAALVAAAGASAGKPYTFKNRTAFERAARVIFVNAQRKHGSGRYVVNSIACAKGGVGRALCAVYATSKRGTQSFTLRISCPSDAGVNCSYDIEVQ